MGRIDVLMDIVDYIEAHLDEKIELEEIAQAVHYSRFHLHRLFVSSVGMTILNYQRRRQMTEAAGMLTGSVRPILEIAQCTGYETQQAFSAVFRALYKQPPGVFRVNGIFYPLQLRFRFEEADKVKKESLDRLDEKYISLASEHDIMVWMQLLRLTVDGFPYLNELDYIMALQRAIRGKRAFLLRDGAIAVGSMILDYGCGGIEFLNVHPLYNKKEICSLLIARAGAELAECQSIRITTFRAGDKADTGYRKMLLNQGFMESMLLYEFGYPTQELLLGVRELPGA